MTSFAFLNRYQRLEAEVQELRALVDKLRAEVADASHRLYVLEQKRPPGRPKKGD
jgi:hypothetical protein